jgi:hypothetical protein
MFTGLFPALSSPTASTIPRSSFSLSALAFKRRGHGWAPMRGERDADLHLSMPIIYTAPMHYRPQDGAGIIIGISLNSDLSIGSESI